ncbi:hypothetical protein K501DRAFT_332515 [Backusella circina FSU 941]|nr:hypothetical protein K501DRAFT_332515 [Backusella circina FSU 941]
MTSKYSWRLFKIKKTAVKQRVSLFLLQHILAMFDFFLTRNSTKLEEIKNELIKSLGRVTYLVSFDSFFNQKEDLITHAFSLNHKEEENKNLKQIVGEVSILKEEKRGLVEEIAKTKARVLELVKNQRTLMDKKMQADQLMTRFSDMRSDLDVTLDELKVEKEKAARLKNEVDYLRSTQQIAKNVSKKEDTSEGGEMDSRGITFVSCPHGNSSKMTIRAVVESDHMNSSAEDNDFNTSDAVMAIVKLLAEENQRECEKKKKKKPSVKK